MLCLLQTVGQMSLVWKHAPEFWSNIQAPHTEQRNMRRIKSRGSWPHVDSFDSQTGSLRESDNLVFCLIYFYHLDMNITNITLNMKMEQIWCATVLCLKSLLLVFCAFPKFCANFSIHLPPLIPPMNLKVLHYKYGIKHNVKENL